MVRTYEIFFLFALWACLFSGAFGKSEDDKELELAVKIGTGICNDDERDDKWFKCIMCCQAKNPYTMKKGVECNSEARKKKYKEAGFTKDTKGKMCGAMSDYSKTLKEMVILHKGDIHSSCSTEKGMNDFFAKKMQCFLGCEDSKGECWK